MLISHPRDIAKITNKVNYNKLLVEARQITLSPQENSFYWRNNFKKVTK